MKLFLNFRPAEGDTSFHSKPQQANSYGRAKSCDFHFHNFLSKYYPKSRRIVSWFPGESINEHEFGRVENETAHVRDSMLLGERFEQPHFSWSGAPVQSQIIGPVDLFP